MIVPIALAVLFLEPVTAPPILVAMQPESTIKSDARLHLQLPLYCGGDQGKQTRYSISIHKYSALMSQLTCHGCRAASRTSQWAVTVALHALVC